MGERAAAGAETEYTRDENREEKKIRNKSDEASEKLSFWRSCSVIKQSVHSLPIMFETQMLPPEEVTSLITSLNNNKQKKKKEEQQKKTRREDTPLPQEFFFSHPNPKVVNSTILRTQASR